MAFYIVGQITDYPAFAITLSPDEISADFNPSSDAWAPPAPTGIGIVDFLWYVVWGLGKLIEMIIWGFAGFPIFLISIGAPTVLVIPITAIIGFLNVLFIIEFASGRQID